MTPFEKQLDQLGQAYVKEMKDQLKKMDGVLTGKLLESISYEVKETRNGYTLQIYMEDYGEFVNSGRRKGAKMPPPAAMMQFVREANIRPRKNQTLESVAFAIGKSISKNGIRPRPFIDKGLQVVDKRLEVTLEDALLQTIELEIE